MNDLKTDVNRQLSWDGTGTLAKANAATVASTSLVIAGRESVEAALKFIDVGMVIDIVNGGTTVVAQAIGITAISGKPTDLTATLTLSAPITCSLGDTLVRSGALSNEIQGLLTSLDGGTTTIYNINRSTYPQFQGNVIDVGAGQLQLNNLQQGWNEARRRGGGKIRSLYSDYDSERMYNKLLVADRRYQPGMKGDGTFSDKEGSYLEFGGVPWVPDKDCPQRVFFLSEENIEKYVLSELEWADETGSYMIAQVGADAFEVRLRLFANLFLAKPAASAVVKNYVSP